MLIAFTTFVSKQRIQSTDSYCKVKTSTRHITLESIASKTKPGNNKDSDYVE